MSPEDLAETLARVLARLDSLEARLHLLETDPHLPAPPRAPAHIPLHLPAEPAPEPAPPARPHLETQVGLTWLNRIGVLTVVLGVAFFFRYAVEKGLIGETGRVLLGVFVGVGALAFAEFLWRRDHRVYAQGITGLGIAILYLSLYSAFGFYHLLPFLAVFLLMFLTTALAGAAALRYNSLAIAALALTGGYLTPLVLATDDLHPWPLFAYLFILLAGGFALVRRQSWRRLEPLLLAGASLVYDSWHIRHFVPAQQLPATIAVLSFYALFWFFASPGFLLASQIFATFALQRAWAEPPSTVLWIVLALSAAGLAGAHRRRWHPLSFTSFLLFWWAAFVWRHNAFPAIPTAGLLALTAAFLLFLAYALWRRTAEPGDLGILALDGLLYFLLCYSLLHPSHTSYLGLFAVALAALHLFAAWTLSKQAPPGAPTGPGRRNPILLSAGVALTFLTLAIPIQFSQFRVTMAWAIEGAAFTWIAARTANRRFGAAALLIFGLAVLRLFFPEPYAPHLLVANPRFLTFLVTGVCLWLGARWMEPGEPALVVYITGHFVMLWALLAETLDWAARRLSDSASFATLAVSVVLALYAIALVVLGVTARSVVNRILGLGLLAIVVLKLYLWDVWQLQQTFRIAAFVVLGILLLAASFLYSRFRAGIEKLWRTPEASSDDR